MHGYIVKNGRKMGSRERNQNSMFLGGIQNPAPMAGMEEKV